MEKVDLSQLYQGLFIEANGTLALTLDGVPLTVTWLTAWGDREQLRRGLADPAHAENYQAQIRLQVRSWIDWCDATTALLEGWGVLAQCGSPRAVVTEWRAHLLTLLDDLDAWNPTAPLLPAFGWYLHATGDDDESI